MGLGQDVLALIIVVIAAWIILPDPIPVIDEIVLIPVLVALVAKFLGDME